MIDTSFSASSGRLSVTIRAMDMGKDMLVIISGGSCHLGAAAVGTITGGLASSSVMTVPGHRDDRVAKPAAEKLSKMLNINVAVVSGIHYDAMTKDEIKETLIICDGLVNRLIEELCKKGS